MLSANNDANPASSTPSKSASPATHPGSNPQQPESRESVLSRMKRFPKVLPDFTNMPLLKERGNSSNSSTNNNTTSNKKKHDPPMPIIEMIPVDEYERRYPSSKVDPRLMPPKSPLSSEDPYISMNGKARVRISPQGEEDNSAKGGKLSQQLNEEQQLTSAAVNQVDDVPFIPSPPPSQFMDEDQLSERDNQLEGAAAEDAAVPSAVASADTSADKTVVPMTSSTLKKDRPTSSCKDWFAKYGQSYLSKTLKNESPKPDDEKPKSDEKDANEVEHKEENGEGDKLNVKDKENEEEEEKESKGGESKD